MSITTIAFEYGNDPFEKLAAEIVGKVSCSTDAEKNEYRNE